MSTKSKKDRIEELDNYSAIFSDTYRNVYGHRPRFSQESWTIEDYEQKLGVLSKIINERVEEERSFNLVSFKCKLKDIMIQKECDWKKAMDLLMDDTKDVNEFLSAQKLSPEKIQEIQSKYFNV